MLIDLLLWFSSFECHRRFYLNLLICFFGFSSLGCHPRFYIGLFVSSFHLSSLGCHSSFHISLFLCSFGFSSLGPRGFYVLTMSTSTKIMTVAPLSFSFLGYGFLSNPFFTFSVVLVTSLFCFIPCNILLNLE